ncbi:MAG: imidazole glycerol phosphate synthase subunit HisH [Christensenellaceae bacterium]|nr:imidazole glycerol phosphate synthase subunit HisH [Christensenellaceae bacterium]
MIAIIDYGMGNLRSVQKALEYLGFDARITDKRQDLIDASHIILPGVGAFGDAIDSLNKSGIRETMLNEIAKGKPFLGICLGMQLLLDRSFENGEYAGLSLVPGDVVPFNVNGLKVPHMGWNNLITRDSALMDAGDSTYVYFVHSYHAAGVPEEYIIAEADYGYHFTAAVCRDNVFGLQFHPEKSGDAGLAMLRRFGGLS